MLRSIEFFSMRRLQLHISTEVLGRAGFLPRSASRHVQMDGNVHVDNEGPPQFCGCGILVCVLRRPWFRYAAMLPRVVVCQA